MLISDVLVISSSVKSAIINLSFSMRTIDPASIPPGEAHRYLLSCVAPRPIAFVGTQSEKGEVNLSPFSFFNAFGANPPVVAFSPAFRGTDGSAKHSFLNIKETGEFTVSVVSYAMVEQMSLASADWPEDVDEFVKSGFTKLPSINILPPGVAESPMVMECKLIEHVDLGGKAASGNLMIGEVVMFHIKESAFEGKYPHHDRLDLVARMGGPFYCRASGSAVFELPKPSGLGVGFDGLPETVRDSRVLTGNHLGKLAGVAELPSEERVREYWQGINESLTEGCPDDLDVELRGSDSERVARVVLRRMRSGLTADGLQNDLHRLAAFCLDHHQVEHAWLALLASEVITEMKGAGMRQEAVRSGSLRKRRRSLVFFSLLGSGMLLCILFSSIDLLAQVNTESYRKKKHKDGFSNTLSANFSLYQGNSDFFKINGRYRGDYTDGRFYSFLVLNYDYGEEADDIFLRDGFAHLRGVHRFLSYLQGEAFVQWGFNDFINLKERVLAGGGGRITVFEGQDSTKHYSLHLGVGGMYEREVEGKGDVASVTTTYLRSTNYLAGRLALEDRLSLNVVTYYQPAVTRMKDYRILLEAGLAVDVFTGLAITTSLNWRYDSDPFPGVESYDLVLSNGLILTF